MKPDSVATIAMIVGAIVAGAQGLNVWMFQKIRIGQLESEKRVLDEVDEKYVRKDSLALHCPATVSHQRVAA